MKSPKEDDVYYNPHRDELFICKKSIFGNDSFIMITRDIDFPIVHDYWECVDKYNFVWIGELLSGC